jgi:regulatory protein
LKIVTALRSGRGQREIKVYLDGELAFSLEAGVAKDAGIKVGGEVSEGEIERLVRRDSRERCRQAAMRYLSYRPRSEAELKRRLAGRGFGEDDISAVLRDLKEGGLVNDAAFAHFWRENRAAFRPRSRSLTSLELARKGVARETIAAAVAGLDDADNAYRAAYDRARRLALGGYEGFCRRLGDYLRRRGFNYEITNKTVTRLWREMKEDASLSGPSE